MHSYMDIAQDVSPFTIPFPEVLLGADIEEEEALLLVSSIGTTMSIVCTSY